ncbi:MAG TPA: hypothetical protein VGX76_15750 [Pirellulales bacterium]|nr:hypothetical protein [Pirellulales bacterium]
MFLDRAQVSDAGLVHLQAFPELQLLSLDSTQVTDAGLPYLKTLTGLRSLDLSNTLVTAAGVDELQEALPHCEIAHSLSSANDGLRAAYGNEDRDDAVLQAPTMHRSARQEGLELRGFEGVTPSR